MSLTDLIPGLKRTATTGGGEWSGACPFCGGRDRFRVWPGSGTTGRFWCRGCGKSGDGIQFLRDREGLGYREACQRLGVEPYLTRETGHGSARATTTRPATWTPRPATLPGEAWRERAGVFLGSFQRMLAGPAGSSCREWLHGSRGLTEATVKEAGLGWNPADRFENLRPWVLRREPTEYGKPRRVWLPAGLVIPCFAGGLLVRLRIRRPEPGDGPRYVVLSGSASSPLTLGKGSAWVVVESELDGLLLHQEAGDLVGVLSMGNAQSRPDQETHQLLKAARLILVSLDTDAAGAKEAWGWWKKHYPHAKRWPVPVGKDPSEAMQKGLNLRSWVLAGLPDPEPSTSTTPEPDTSTKPAPAPPTAHQDPPGATNPAKEYHDQGSARRTVFEPFPAEWKTRYNEDELERLAVLTVEAGLSDLEAAEVIGRC